MLELSLCWLLLLPSSIAKGRSWWQVLQGVDVPLLRTAVCARGQPSSHAECAIRFSGLDLAHHFLLKQPVAKLTNTSLCSESVWLLHGKKGCSHQILSRGYKWLPLCLQHSWVTEIPHSDTHKSHPAFLLCWHRALSALFLVQHISSAEMEALKISGESRWRFLLILCQWKHSSSTQHS